MHRASYLDLAYTHEMLVAPVQPAPAPAAKACEGVRDLVARLQCLKALMDAERDAAPAKRDPDARHRVH